MSDEIPVSNVQTATDIPLDEDRPVKVGSCIVTTVYLDSERPRGRIRHRPVKVVEAGTGDGAIVDSAELQQLAELGLPTTFASAQKARSSGGSVEKHTQQRSHPSRTVTSTTAGADASFSKDRWIQAYDAALQQHYFIPPGSQQPQWEPPPETASDCLPPPFAWSQALSELRQSAARVTADAAVSNQAAAGEAEVHVLEVHSSMQPDHSAAEPAVAEAVCSGASRQAGATSAAPASVDAPDAADAAPAADEWVRGPMPRNLWKYWMQRYTLFARFDDGVLLDVEGWFSVTPEAIARHHARRCACDTLLDPFAGIGGNVIQMAATCRRVIAGELSPERTSLIRHNANVYGAADRIEARCCDFWDSSAPAEADVVFLSPPWGGPLYLSQPVFDVQPRLGSMSRSLGDLLRRARDGHMRKQLYDRSSTASPDDSRTGTQQEGSAAVSSTRGVVAFLPKNTSLEQLSDLVLPGHTIEVERNILDGFFKGITVYFWDGSWS